MSGNTTNPENTSTNEDTTTVASNTAAPPKAKDPAPPAAKEGENEPMFLKDRLDRERRAILKDLGIKLKRGEDPQERIEAYAQELETDRTASKALRDKIADYENKLSQLAASTAAVKVFADTEFAALTDAQKAIVIASAGDDPNERLKTIAIMKAMKPEPAVTPEAPKPPIPAPAQTAPAVGGPTPGAAPGQVVDVKTEHARLKESNPLVAASYLLANLSTFTKQS